MAQLILLQEGEATAYDLKSDETVIGRHPECNLQINSNMVSRKHARVFKDGDGYRVEDMGSGNGTYVNGKKVETPTVLNHEDRIKLGPILLRFECDVAPGQRVVPLHPTAPSKQSRKSADQPTPFNLELDDNDASSTMTSKATGFGQLDVQPEVKLKGVLEISKALAGATDSDEILPKILDTLFEIFPKVDRGCILLKDEATGKMLPQAMKHRRLSDDDTVKLSRTILRTVLEQKTGILSFDASNDTRFQASESIANLTIRSMMCVPMLSTSGEPMGVINVDTQNAFNQFHDEDLDLLMTVGGQAAMYYEQARLLVTATEKLKQDKEMEIATGVQLAMLPKKMPAADGWEFFASYDTALAVGGDYYDAFFLEGGKKVCLAFGDVAGKGVPASLVMSRIATVVTNVMTFVKDVSEAIIRINNQMCERAIEGRFVTFCLCVIDLNSSQMTTAIAGHMPIMIRKTDGSIEEFGGEIVGVPIGVIEDFPYQVATRTIQPGETCVIYTDGVSEAMNPENELYGVDRLRNLIKASAAGQADQLGKVILGDVRKFANGRDQNDDITIMVFGRK